MKLTTKGRFAVTAMLDIAVSESTGTRTTLANGRCTTKPVTLSDISERQSISLSYLEQLFSRLRKNGLVASVRGPGGGYKLTKPTTEISVAEIINAVDEKVDATQCGGRENCHDDGPCMTHELWSNLNTKIFEYLDSVSLADIVASKTNNHKIIVQHTKTHHMGNVVHQSCLAGTNDF